MAGYSYSVSLRIWHPSRRPEEITAALGMEPGRSWMVGAPRTTPRGRPLKGVNRETFWIIRLVDDSYETRDLAAALAAIVDTLSAKESFFSDLATSGGRSEFFIGWFFDQGNSGEVLNHELLAKLAALQIDLSFDVYPEIQTASLVGSGTT